MNAKTGFPELRALQDMAPLILKSIGVKVPEETYLAGITPEPVELGPGLEAYAVIINLPEEVPGVERAVTAIITDEMVSPPDGGAYCWIRCAGRKIEKETDNNTQQE